jgi:hypothetical protein
VDWRKVSAALPSRNNKDCRKRWLKIDATWRQGQWSKPEDTALKKAFAIHGSKWKAVSDEIGTRNPDRKQTVFEGRGKADNSQECAKRWRNALDPTLVRGDWSADDVRHTSHPNIIVLTSSGFET